MRGTREVRELLVALQHLGQRSSTSIPRHPPHQARLHTAAWAEVGGLRGGGWLWHSKDELMTGDMGFSDLRWEPGCLKG